MENGTRDGSAITGEPSDDERWLHINFSTIAVYFSYHEYLFAKFAAPTIKLCDVEIDCALSYIMCVLCVNFKWLGLVN